MKSPYETLFESIRARCQRERWYGPELLHPERRTRVSVDDPSRFGFAFPPATNEELQATEVELGFSLPPLLRSLYSQVANGGFGPGSGLRGVLSGYGKPGTIYPDDDYTIVAQYRFSSAKQAIDLVEYTGQLAEQGIRVNLELPYGVWPRYLLPICDMGCVQQACVDSEERMFHVGALESDNVYWLYQMPWTFEEWLWRWVRGEELMVRYVEQS